MNPAVALFFGWVSTLDRLVAIHTKVIQGASLLGFSFAAMGMPKNLTLYPDGQIAKRS
jgi:hypothetical protein